MFLSKNTFRLVHRFVPFGFDSLRVASQSTRGFRAKVEARSSSNLKRTDDDIHVAAKAWCEDAEAAREIYGHIGIWNPSEVTNMWGLFSTEGEELGAIGEAASHFNEDISRWDVSNVTEMEMMFWGASAFNCDISTWNIANVECVYSMFSGAFHRFTEPQSWTVMYHLDGIISITLQFEMWLKLINLA